MIEPIALPFGKKKTIRAVVLDGAIWFVASDLFKPFKRYTDRESLSSFRDEDLRVETLDTDAGTKRFTLVSTLGALTVATLLPDNGPRIIDAWVRRELSFQASPWVRPSMREGGSFATINPSTTRSTPPLPGHRR